MNKVITINLNGTAYQIEESGYEGLRSYLDQASAKLDGNPDQEEIMRDFEQAVAEKCQAYLSTSKNVVTASEVQKILAAMGPVEADDSAHTDSTSSSSNSTHAPNTSPKRFYRIVKGEMIMGVCNGIAAYFNVDVTLVRVAAVILAVLTHGGFIFGYILLGIFMPVVSVPGDTGAQTGRPFNARDFIEHAQQNYAAYRTDKPWKQWKRQWKYERRYGVAPSVATSSYRPTPASMAFFPIMNLVQGLLTVGFVVALIDLISHHAIYTFSLPANIPLWVGIIGLIILYKIIVTPFKMLKMSMLYGAHSYPASMHHGFSRYSPFWHTLASIFWMIAWIAFAWYAYVHIPQVHAAFDSVAVWWNHLLAS